MYVIINTSCITYILNIEIYYIYCSFTFFVYTSFTNKRKNFIASTSAKKVTQIIS